MTDVHLKLREWLGAEHPGILRIWSAEIRARHGSREADGAEVLELFLEVLLSLLPHCLGKGKSAVEADWQQATHLYGSFALQRGLAAGEVVEELQILREVILRRLLEFGTTDWEHRRFQHELLTLNRILDLGVAQASVAYVDDLFFAHLQGPGVPDGVTPELESEVIRQLEAFRRDLPT